MAVPVQEEERSRRSRQPNYNILDGNIKIENFMVN